MPDEQQPERARGGLLLTGPPARGEYGKGSSARSLVGGISKRAICKEQNGQNLQENGSLEKAGANLPLFAQVFNKTAQEREVVDSLGMNFAK